VRIDMKRRVSKSDAERQPPSKRPKISRDTERHPKLTVVVSLLGQYYQCIQTLRQYMLCRLPKTSRIRRRKIAMLGYDTSGVADLKAPEHVKSLCQALDTTLVSSQTSPRPLLVEEKRQEWLQLSQLAVGDDSTVTITSKHRDCCQAEVCFWS